MSQKQFLQDGDYRVGDSVIVMEKQYKITGISKNTATLTRRDGTGQKEEQKMKLVDLPQKNMTVSVGDSPVEEDAVEVVETPGYEKGQKLANGWVVVRPSVRGKYMVRINGSQQEMTGHMIHTAELDYLKRKAELDEEKRIHEQAEAYAKAEMVEHYEKQERVEKVSSVKRDDANGSADGYKTTGIPQEVAEIFEKIQTLGADIDKMNEGFARVASIEERIVNRLAAMGQEQADHREEMASKLAEQADRYDERIRAIEKALAGHGVPPIPSMDVEVEVMTRVQSFGAGWDKELAKHLNDGWRILKWTDLTDSKRTVCLVRERQDVIEVDDGEDIRILDIPTAPRVVSGKIAITDVTEKYAGLSGEALLLAQRFDADIDANTRRIMGDEWYGKFGA